MNFVRSVDSIVLYLCLCIAICQYSCNGCGEILGETCSINYSIDIPFEVTPDTSSFSMGDSITISMFLPDNSIDNLTNDSLDLRNLLYDVDIVFLRLIQENKEYAVLSLEQFNFDNDMMDGGVNRIGDTQRTTGNLIFEEVEEGRICVFKFAPKIEGLLCFYFSYSDRLLDESDHQTPNLDFTETCCTERAEIHNVKIGGNTNNFQLVNNDTLAWSNNGIAINLTNEDLINAGIFLFQVE